MSQHRFLKRLAAAGLVQPHGTVRRILPGRIEADGPRTVLGALCRIGAAGPVAEVAAVDADGIVLVPVEEGDGVAIGDRVEVVPDLGWIGVGDLFGGRAIDALGRPIDGGAVIEPSEWRPPSGRMPAMLDRVPPRRVLETGIRAIDTLLTLGEGQRIGIFAASGVGKTSLVAQLMAQARASRCVLCLVGERGREIEDFWREMTSRSDRAHVTLVAATSDVPAAMRARSVDRSLCLAEYWRDRGEHVLLVIDSVTRLAMALREIGLAAGEPPTVRAYTPNVFAALPRIVERCGAVRAGGAITAVMTVLTETDEVEDPLAETMKSLLDGHILLSRSLAEHGHFPAIDVTRSVSRQAARLITRAHRDAARGAVAQLAAHDDARVMIQSGLYQPGTDAAIDDAVAGRAALLAFLRQPGDERTPFADSVGRLQALMGTGGGDG